MTVYADELFAVNFASNILLLIAYRQLRGMGKKRLRIAAAAALGALYAVFETVFAFTAAFRIPLLVIMTCVAFGARGLIENTLGVMFVSVCAEGLAIAVTAFSGARAALAAGQITLFASEPAMAAVYISAYPLLMIFYRIIGKKRRKRRVVLEYGGKKTSFLALYDSGNLLRYNGLPVIVIGSETARELIDFTSYDELTAAAPELLRYNTVGGGGVMPVFVPERCTIDGAEVRAAAAVAERGFEMGCGGITCI